MPDSVGRPSRVNQNSLETSNPHEASDTAQSRSLTGSDLIDVHLERLRKKIDPPVAKATIPTVRESGYILT